MLVACPDQRQPALLRDRAAERFACECAPEIGGERRPLAHGVDPGLFPWVGEHCRDIASGEDMLIGG